MDRTQKVLSYPFYLPEIEQRREQKGVEEDRGRQDYFSYGNVNNVKNGIAKCFYIQSGFQFCMQLDSKYSLIIKPEDFDIDRMLLNLNFFNFEETIK